MAIIEDPKLTITVGLIINLIFMIVKFFAFLYSHVNLFFTDAIDSFVDSFIIFLIFIFLDYNINDKYGYHVFLSMVNNIYISNNNIFRTN